VELKPDHAMAHARLGMALCAKGAFKDGLPHLSKAVDLDPDNTSVRYNFAITLARLRQHSQAIPQWLQILQRDPRNANVLSCLAASYAETGRIDEALKFLEQARSIAQVAGDAKLIEQITKQITLYGQKKSSTNSPGKAGDR